MSRETFTPIPCPVCGGDDFRTVLTLTPDEFLNEKRKAYYKLDALEIDLHTPFTFKRCRRCTFVLVNPRFRADLYEVAYNEAKIGQNDAKDWAFEEGDLKSLYNTYHKSQAVRFFLTALSYFGDRFAKAKNDGMKRITLLDYGCGFGHVLDLCRVFELDGRGVDIDKFRLDACRRKGLVVSTPENLPPDETFDIVISTSVVEHVNDLNSYFSYIARRLKPGGIFVFNGLTPRIIDIERKRGRYQLVVPIEHLNYFTRKSLTQITANHGLAPARPTHLVQTITSPYQYIAPIASNLIFRGFRPNGLFTVVYTVPPASR